MDAQKIYRLFALQLVTLAVISNEPTYRIDTIKFIYRFAKIFMILQPSRISKLIIINQ